MLIVRDKKKSIVVDARLKCIYKSKNHNEIGEEKHKRKRNRATSKWVLSSFRFPIKLKMDTYPLFYMGIIFIIIISYFKKFFVSISLMWVFLFISLFFINLFSFLFLLFGFAFSFTRFSHLSKCFFLYNKLNKINRKKNQKRQIKFESGKTHLQKKRKQTQAGNGSRLAVTLYFLTMIWFSTPRFGLLYPILYVYILYIVFNHINYILFWGEKYNIIKAHLNEEILSTYLYILYISFKNTLIYAFVFLMTCWCQCFFELDFE